MKKFLSVLGLTTEREMSAVMNQLSSVAHALVETEERLAQRERQIKAYKGLLFSVARGEKEITLAFSIAFSQGAESL